MCVLTDRRGDDEHDMSDEMAQVRMYEQALVCLSNRETLDVSRVHNGEYPFFSCWDGLVYLGMYLPLIKMAFGLPSSTLAVEIFYSETRACS